MKMLKISQKLRFYVLLILTPAIACCSFVSAAEFEVVDKLLVNGRSIFKSSITIYGLTSQSDILGMVDPLGNYKVVITTAGNVGIGTASPGALLDVTGDGSTVLLPRKSAAGDPAGPANGMIYYNASSNKFRCYQAGAWTDCVTSASGDNLGNHTAALALNMSNKAVDNVSSMTITGTGVSGSDPLFKVAGSTMVVLNNGNVGIGTTGPGSRFEVVGGSSTFKGSDSNSAIAGFTDAGGTYRVVISTAGNVGIGMTNPGYKLDVTGDIRLSGQLTSSINGISASFINNGGNQNAIRVGNSQGDIDIGVLNPYVGSGGSILTTNSTPLTLGVNNSASLTINTSGNVGIGTTGPGGRLDVVGSAGVVPLIVSTGSAVGSEVFRINSSGNVGIGTTGPTRKLSVDLGNASNITNDVSIYSSGSEASLALRNISVGGRNYQILSTGAGSGLSAGKLIFYDATLGGNNYALVVDGAAGNVGIGTTAPGYRLHVSSGAGEAGTVMAVSTGTSNLFWVAGDGAHAVKFFGDGSGLTNLAGTGDNLGNHTAKQALDMASKAIDSISSMTVTGAGVSGSDPLFKVAGSTMVVLNNGNVGIGTTGPEANLQILSQSGDGTLGVWGQQVASSNAILKLRSRVSSANEEAHLSMESDGKFYIKVPSAQNKYGDVTAVTIQNNGNVGIGTTGPSTALHVYRTAASLNQPLLRVEAVDTGQSTYASDLIYGSVNRGDTNAYSLLNLSNVGTARFLVSGNGNVGIGTTGPGSKLEVAGGSITIRGSDSNSAIAGFTDAGGNYRAVISTAGNVGIGTTGPGAKLEVYDSADSTLWPAILRNSQEIASANYQVGMKLYLAPYATSGNNANKWAGILAANEANWANQVGLAFYTNNNVDNPSTEKVRITASGNVGIGTTGPGGRLDVVGSGTVVPLIVSTGTAAGQEVFRINSSGNVGIGTTAPDANVEVHIKQSAVNGNADLYLENDAQKWGVATRGDFADSFVINDVTGSSPKVTIQTGGNVGIGTTGPGAKLDVAGNINATQWITGGCVNPGDAADIMVAVGPWCVDKYEASVWSTSTGGTQYGIASDDYICNDNGQDCGVGAANPRYARSVSGVAPSANLTWFQANMACFNAGKELLPNAVWQAAASGTTDPGATGSGVNCNVSGGAKENTGGATGCVSTSGAEDMIGNVWEWVAEWGTAGAGASAAYGTMVEVDGTGTGYNNDGQWNIGGNSYTNYAAPAGWIQGQIPAVFRGGSWGAGADAGVFAFGADNAPSSWGGSLGFRCGRRR